MATQKPSAGADQHGPIKAYLSPYEYWNFGKGRDYAFPSVRKNTKYICAFAELVPRDPLDEFAPTEQPGLLPTLWRKYRNPRFLPFITQNRTGHPIVDVALLGQLLLGGL